RGPGMCDCEAVRKKWARLKPLPKRELFGVEAGHADDAVAAIDVGDFSGDARGQVRAQERGGVADVLDGDGAADRGIGLDVAEDLAEAADAGRGQGLDRAGRDRVDADAFRTEVQRQVAHAGLE